MFELTKYYVNTHGYSGVGSDIKWCGRWRSGKLCMYCKHHAEFEEWSEKWHWNYITSWSDNWGMSRDQSHYKIPQLYNTRVWIQEYYWGKIILRPPRYRTTGISEQHIKSLLRKGCRPKRKCKCASVAQRSSWYCPTCYELMNKMAKHYKRCFHDITIVDRSELKEDVLILLLSGTI